MREEHNEKTLEMAIEWLKGQYREMQHGELGISLVIRDGKIQYWRKNSGENVKVSL